MGSYLNNEDVSNCPMFVMKDDEINENYSPPNSSNVANDDRKILVGNSFPSAARERERENVSPTCLAGITEGSEIVPDICTNKTPEMNGEEVMSTERLIQNDENNIDVWKNRGTNDENKEFVATTIDNYDNTENRDGHSSDETGNGDDYNYDQTNSSPPSITNTFVGGNASIQDLAPSDSNASSKDRNGHDVGFRGTKESSPDNGVCLESSEEDVLIETEINEVRDSLLHFSTLNSNEIGGKQTTSNELDELDSLKGQDLLSQEPKAVSPHLAGEGRGFSRSHDAVEHNTSNCGPSESEKSTFECSRNNELKIGCSVVRSDDVNEENMNFDIKNKDNFFTDTKDVVEDTDEAIVRSLVNDFDSFKEEDNKGKDFYINPFENISSADHVETFCDVETSCQAEVTLKDTPKLKPKENTKKNKKGKKPQRTEPVIDDDVLNEVKTLLAKAQTKENISQEPTEDAAATTQPKTKEKKKKVKKTKRSNSKTDGASPISLPEDGASPTQRRILKRGTVWKEKAQTELNSPTPGDGEEVSFEMNRSVSLERSLGGDSSDQRESVLSSPLNISKDIDLTALQILEQKTSEIIDKLATCSDSNFDIIKDNISKEIFGSGPYSSSSEIKDSNTISNNFPTCDLVSGDKEATLFNEIDEKDLVICDQSSNLLARFPDLNSSSSCNVGGNESKSPEIVANINDDRSHNEGQLDDANEGNDCILRERLEADYSNVTNDTTSKDGNASPESAKENGINDESKHNEEQLDACRMSSRPESVGATVSYTNQSVETETNHHDLNAILLTDNTKLVNGTNEYEPDNDSEVFTFSTTVSVVKPLRPSIEFVSDNSSPISTRSSSLDREIVPISISRPPDQKALKEEDNCMEEVCVPPLFDHVDTSKLDGTNKLQLKNKKRHSLPKNKLLERKNSANNSFNAENRSECLDLSIPLGSNYEEDLEKYYEGPGEILYDERCTCSHDSAYNPNKSESKVGEPTTNFVDKAETQMTKEPQCQNPSDDSDDTDTWHPKNIKEKIKRIIGARLQPAPDRDNLKEISPDIKDTSPLPRSSSHSASSKSSSEARDSVSDSARVPTSTEPEGSKDKDDDQPPRSCSEGETAEEEEIDRGKYQQKLSFNAKHLNLTYLTDSDDPLCPDLCEEDTVVLNSLREVGKKDENDAVTNIVQRWETLQSKAAERQRQSMQLRQLQRQVKSLRLSMEGVLNRCATFAHPHTLDDPSEIGQKVEEVKALLEETENLRSDLSNLNVMVHRFTSEIGSSFTPLKDEMAELYRLWDETHRRVNSELSSLQSAEATWRLWEEQKAELSQALKQDSDTLKVIDAAIDNGRLTETVTASVHDVAKLLNERRIPNSVKAKNQMLTVELSGPGEKNGKTKIEMEGGRDDRLSDSGTSGYESCSSDDLSERERRLAYLRRLARDLEASLVPGSKAWNEISTTLTEAEKELQGLQDHCRNLVLRTAETFDPSSKQPRFSSNNKRRNWAREAKSCRSPRVERRSKSGGNFRREWIWRVVRAALPFQAALMLLLCVTCLLEPHCCDSVNTLNLNFTPQLRFVHGSPPV